MRRRVTVVVSVVSVCVCGASVRPENIVTYSGGNEGQKIFSETAPLQRSSTPFVERPYVYTVWNVNDVIVRERKACP